MSRIAALTVISTVLGQAALAEAAIVTDSPVVQSFVAKVTDTVPGALMPAGADPHHFALRPSQMKALQQAEWLIWVGPEFSTWLEGPAAQLPASTQVLKLANGNAHAWLDPVIADAWTQKIAGALGYSAGPGIWDAVANELREELTGLAGIGLLSGHDAYAEFGARFGLNFVGSISDSHAHDPGPAHLAHLREMIAGGVVGCVLSDSHEIEGYVDLVVEGSDIPVVEVDLTGHGIAPGADFYPDLLRGVADALKGCVP